MPCKHEGGTDPCELYANGCCKGYAKEHYRNNKEKRVAQNKARYLPSGRPRGFCTNTGYVNELLAVADMSTRCGAFGGWAYLNPAPQTADDAFAKTSDGWRTIQVRTARLFKDKNGGVTMNLSHGKKKFSSDVIAVVDDRNLRVRYIGNKCALPKEFPAKPTKILKGVVYLNNPEQP